LNGKSVGLNRLLLQTPPDTGAIMHPVNGIQARTVRLEFPGAGLNNPQGWPIRLQSPYGMGLLSVHIAATVQGQRSLSAGHCQINVGEYLGIQKRSMQVTL